MRAADLCKLPRLARFHRQRERGSRQCGDRFFQAAIEIHHQIAIRQDVGVDQRLQQILIFRQQQRRECFRSVVCAEAVECGIGWREQRAAILSVEFGVQSGALDQQRHDREFLLGLHDLPDRPVTVQRDRRSGLGQRTGVRAAGVQRRQRVFEFSGQQDAIKPLHNAIAGPQIEHRDRCALNRDIVERDIIQEQLVVVPWHLNARLAVGQEGRFWLKQQ